MGWQDVFKAKDIQELKHQYDLWAEHYDDDVKDYVGPEHTVSVLTRFVTPQVRILDAGCGTGLSGQILHAQGYRHVEGLDISTQMLATARRKNCYAALHQQTLGSRLDLPSDCFDAVVCLGIFARGHAPSSCFDELIRVTVPGGYIFTSLRTLFYENSDFKSKMTALEESGKWRLVEKGQPFRALPASDPEFFMQVWAHEILKNP